MPLVAHTALPSFERLRQRGQEVLTLTRATTQDIRELHIGLLNMMPDAALEITERQFMRLVGNSNQIAQFYVHVFSLPGLERSAETQAYIDQYYTSFERVKADGLDALIITGANVANPSLDQEDFWHPLTEVIEWARLERDLNPLLLPLDPRADEVLSRHRARQTRPKKMGRLRAPRHPASAPAAARDQYAL